MIVFHYPKFPATKGICYLSTDPQDLFDAGRALRDLVTAMPAQLTQPVYHGLLP